MNCKYVLYIILFALISYNVFSASSIGISPTYNIIIYKGEELIEGSFVIDPTSEKNVEIGVRGPLRDYISFEENAIELKLHMTESKEIKYFLDLPKDMKPGEYVSDITVRQYLTPEETIHYGGFARAFAAVGYIVKIRVPNDGKFLEVSMKTDPARINIGNVVYFEIDMLNFGTEDLTDLQADVVVRAPDGKILSEKKSNKVSLLNPSQSAQLLSYWDTQGASAGIYTAEAKIEYGGQVPAEPKIDFRVGDILIKILNVTTELNESIAKIFIDIESNWNEIIENVYAELVIKNGSKTITTIKTSSVDLEPWGKARLTAFWDRKSLPVGKYDIDIYVYYYDKQAEKQMRVELGDLEKKSPRDNSLLLIISVLLLGVIFLVNITWFLFNLKSKRDKTKKKR